MKLGGAMIRSNLITQDELKQALERQAVFGCREGTNILELGFVREDDRSPSSAIYSRACCQTL
jgi:hypothetical protein